MRASSRHHHRLAIARLGRPSRDRRIASRHIVVILALLGALTLAAAPALAGAAHQHAAVSWHGQQMVLGHAGVVPGADASLVRNPNGISYRITTRDLEPGHAYTLWLVVINDPSFCTASPCTAHDILAKPATASQVSYAAGHVVGGSGRATFAGSVRVGPLSGWLEDRSLVDPFAADVQLVINDHGPKLPAFMPAMIQTYRGGCAASSPFPPIFPPSALADGDVGPNICRLSQVATFSAP